MPRTLEDAFAQFHARLKPTASDLKLTRRHRATIRACLESNFELRAYDPCGSFGNGTSIADHSDADYLAQLLASEFSTDSRAALCKVRVALAKRFPHTKVRVNSPAVRVPFGSLPCETTEVVPAKLCGRTATGRAIYQIADGAGGWLRTSPHAHNAYVKARDEVLQGRLKPLICFMKAWKYFNGVPISSFYLEMRTARHMAKKSTVNYARDLAALFAELEQNLADVRDPVGVSGLIKPCASPVQTHRTRSKLQTAASRAAKACQAAARGNICQAFKWWRLVFGDRFPAFN